MLENTQIEETDDLDPSVIPEEIKEYVKMAHQRQQESRPDESWRIAPPPKAEHVAPYKRDDEDIEREQEDMATETPAQAPTEIPAEIPHFAEGGVVGYADGGDVPDPNDLLSQLAPMGTGILAPSPAMPKPVAAPIAPAMAPEPPAPVMAPKPPIAPAPAPTDATYTERANKLLGLDPTQQANLLKTLGGRSLMGQLGAGIAGVGDAIASGGTLGKVNPGNADRAETLINNREKAGIEGMQTIRGNQEKAQELGDKLQSRDPSSPLSKFAQKAYASVGKKLGLDLSNASASLIGDVTGKGVDALNTEYQNQLKMLGLSQQKEQIDATIANQKAERETARQGQQLTASEKLGSRTIGNKLEGLIPGTPANTEKHTLERIAGGVATGPLGAETVRQGKTYEWSPETGKYHLKR